MDKIKIFFGAHKILKIFMWAFLILLGLFIILVIYRVFYSFNLDKTNAQVEKIHNTKLFIDDVMGVNLPSDPGIEVDKTVQGIDANQNGIRDDVELAIFKEYPNSAKTRAVLLQYALVLQIETEQNINKDTATAVAEKESQSYDCIGKIVPISNDDIQEIKEYRNYVESIQLNTVERKNLKIKFDNNVGSFELQSGCDVDLDLFPN
ncbi:hypothetical protein COU48_00765 [Candidatus Nomurabacteria bacterium CG10_big_fil_rev_8_21_14_0_10_03_31_7]|uniref:Uncharacterized protein n=1 Tax=Candidatus Nomurabacteria bacterium CG10_big_fil_rev_8_21_14_0_10_03_31_7 TaxID=1974730 RepID=A0A2J0JI98_9BACT|nr:MAG: hypothetical protein COU48_00765 [Candidatus Nomurabacteria bacterium CG10_big_fil_rev_8_21_14_0_10_03_31_7]